MRPQNIGVLKNPDGTGKVGNPRCGDIMQVQIEIEKNSEGKEIIKTSNSKLLDVQQQLQPVQ